MFLRRAEWKKDGGETPGHRGLLTWTGGAAVPVGHGAVPAGLLAGHLLAGNLSQLGKQKETGEKSISPAQSSTLEELLHQQLDPRKGLGQKLQGLVLT